MEIDDANHVTKSGYGVFDLSWQSVFITNGRAIEKELHDIRDGIKRTHGQICVS